MPSSRPSSHSTRKPATRQAFPTPRFQKRPRTKPRPARSPWSSSWMLLPATGRPSSSTRSIRQGRQGAKAMSYAEQISAFENSRAAKASEQKSIMDEAAAAGETLDADKQEAFDTLQTEIEAIDGHLKRLRQVEKSVG